MPLCHKSAPGMQDEERRACKERRRDGGQTRLAERSLVTVGDINGPGCGCTRRQLSCLSEPRFKEQKYQKLPIRLRRPVGRRREE